MTMGDFTFGLKTFAEQIHWAKPEAERSSPKSRLRPEFN